MEGSPPGSSVHGIFQARILGWIAISFPWDLPDAGIEPRSLEYPELAGGGFIPVPPGKSRNRIPPLKLTLGLYLLSVSCEMRVRHSSRADNRLSISAQLE